MVPAPRPSPSTDANEATPAPRPSPRRRVDTTASGIALPTRPPSDIWNSASTGHQRAENRLSGSTSWRDSRNQKLAAQYQGAFTGGKCVADGVGAGGGNFGKDSRKPNVGWLKGTGGLRGKSQKSILESFGTTSNPSSHGPAADIPPTATPNPLQPHSNESLEVSDDPSALPPSFQPPHVNEEQHEEPSPPKKQIFRNLCIYINGTTAPLISDHKLKCLLAQHGARMSIALGRRSVTHVILGNTHGKGGAGGGLAGTKIQKEISRVGGKGIKFVSVEWWDSLCLHFLLD
jgi:hypothetical protein